MQPLFRSWFRARQAAPFRKGPPRPDPKTPGRKPGDAHGTHGHRPPPPPDQVAECHDASLPDACPHWHGRLVETGTADQFQTEIPRQPLVRKFRVHIGHCEACVWEVRLVALGDLFGGRAVAVLAVGVAGLTAGGLRVGLGRTLAERGGLPLAGAEGVVKVPGQLGDPGFEFGDLLDEFPTTGTGRFVHTAMLHTSRQMRK